MKKLIPILAVLALVVSIGATQVFAAETNGRGRYSNTACVSSEQCRQNFADEDRDGVCDSRSQCVSWSFVDEDRNGVCDNRAARTNRGCASRTQSRCHGNGHRRGCR